MIVLKATQDKVLSVLQSVAGIVERRHTLPILANVLIRKTGTALQVTTSDLEIQVRTTADLDGDAGNFATTVGARKLIDILSRNTTFTLTRDASLGLHFDLTVPLARYVLENAGKLQFPLRRYQIQRSWRGERPQEGRYREFTQADIDIIDVDTLAPHFEAELPLILAGIFARLPVGDFVVKVNNRLICEGFYRGIGIEDVATTLRIWRDSSGK